MPKELFTAYTCDRCNQDNAIKISVPEDEGDIKEVDLCIFCAIRLIHCLLHKVKQQDRDIWLKSFLSGIIQ